MSALLTTTLYVASGRIPLLILQLQFLCVPGERVAVRRNEDLRAVQISSVLARRAVVANTF